MRTAALRPRWGAALVILACQVLLAAASARRRQDDGGFLGLDADADADAAPDADNGDGLWAHVHVADGVPAEGAGSLGVVADGANGFQLVALPAQDSTQLLASGTFTDSLADLGWSSLSMRIAAGGGASDTTKMYAAGLVEGFLTAKRIREFHHNSRALLEMNSDNAQRLPKLEKALGQLVAELGGSSPAVDDGSRSPFDTQVSLALQQTRGVRDGYLLALDRIPGGKAARRLSMVDMLILNSDGVIDELLSKYSSAGGSFLQRLASHRRAPHGAIPAHPSGGRTRHRKPTGHCTGVVRLSEDHSELYFGHTTWEAFSEMTRVWKVYDFPLQGVAAKKISFSSYPGCISSTDDYYLMDSGLAITETTLSIPTEQAYPSASSVPDFIRIMAANRLSANAADWVRSMSDSATGTYSSQWMVLDYSKFTPGSTLPEGTFFVLEQAPGISHYEDMSSWLQREGYWASFDRAFFDDVRERTGDAAMYRRLRDSSQDAQAEVYSKSQTPRAQIVRQAAHGLNSLGAMRAEMTSNRGTEEQVDQPSLRKPRYAISARDDLADGEHNDPDGSPDGGVDAKITSYCLFQSLAAEAISSPSHSTLPPFRWTGDDGSETWPGYPHEGLPNVANFGWVRAGPPSDGSEVPVAALSGDGGCQ